MTIREVVCLIVMLPRSICKPWRLKTSFHWGFLTKGALWKFKRLRLIRNRRYIHDGRTTCTYSFIIYNSQKWMNDMGYRVAGHLRHKGATPRPPAGIVVKHPKTAWQPSGHCPSHMFLCTDTPSNQCLSYKSVFKRWFFNLACINRPKMEL